MRKSLFIMTAFAVMLPASVGVSAPASAHVRNYAHHHYHGRTIRNYRSCRHSPGNAGLIAGGVGGAVVGSQVIGHGILGIGAGAVGGALAGRAVDRSITAKRRCR